MKIVALPKVQFDDYMKMKNITPANVEQQDKVAFISINDPIIDPGVKPYFPEDKENVKVMYFGDLDKDIPLKILKRTVWVKAMTVEQAIDLYKFIKKHRHKPLIIVHCTAGVSRSGAVASFIHDYTSGNWEDFKKLNPHILPNHHVYKLLHDVWYEDHKIPNYEKY